MFFAERIPSRYSTEKERKTVNEQELKQLKCTKSPSRCGDVFAFSSLRNHISFLMFTCMHLFGSAGSPWLLGFLWLRQAGPALCGGAQASH